MRINGSINTYKIKLTNITGELLVILLNDIVKNLLGIIIISCFGSGLV
jgi:hypothetical protein